MDGSRTVARLVAEFARICGRLAPDQVTRVVADLAGNRMLDELPSTRSSRWTGCTGGRGRSALGAAACSPSPGAAGSCWPTSTRW